MNQELLQQFLELQRIANQDLWVLPRDLRYMKEGEVNRAKQALAQMRPNVLQSFLYSIPVYYTHKKIDIAQLGEDVQNGSIIVVDVGVLVDRLADFLEEKNQGQYPISYTADHIKELNQIIDGFWMQDSDPLVVYVHPSTVPFLSSSPSTFTSCQNRDALVSHLWSVLMGSVPYVIYTYISNTVAKEVERRLAKTQQFKVIFTNCPHDIQYLSNIGWTRVLHSLDVEDEEKSQTNEKKQLQKQKKYDKTK